MKIKFGSATEEINRMSNDIFKDGNTKERIAVELKNTDRSVADVDELLEQNFTGTLVLVDDEEKEESFSGYELESIRKNYDSTGKQISLMFKTPGSTLEEE